ncbi:hypothetical protein H1235_11785 [Pseudoxanthomonas sp. NC8]|nr:hypothetical protein H1235_11785 [Pseudoxanthomonas sp. NC8]
MKLQPGLRPPPERHDVIDALRGFALLGVCLSQPRFAEPVRIPRSAAGRIGGQRVQYRGRRGDELAGEHQVHHALLAAVRAGLCAAARTCIGPWPRRRAPLRAAAARAAGHRWNPRVVRVVG